MAAYALDAQMELNLLGIEVVWPLNIANSDQNRIDMMVEPQSDHLILLRRFGEKSNYTVKDTVRPRRLEDMELMTKARSSNAQ